jgi:putative transposase
LHTLWGLSPGQAERTRRLARKAGRQETARRRRPPSGRRRSARHRCTLERLARLRAREARIRVDFLHKLSRELAKNHGLVAIEALRINAMTHSAKGTVDEPGMDVAQKRALNHAILSSGWGEFTRQLAYKTTRTGGVLVMVSAAHTSQTCAACGHVDEASRQGRKFQCTQCRHESHADINAARVILARALEAQGDGGRAWPSQHGEPSAKARRRTVNHPEVPAA